MVFTDIMMKMELLSQKKFNKFLSLFLLICSGVIAHGQSCVCYQNHFLKDYKEADFVAQISVTAVNQNYETVNQDRIDFSTITTYKGEGSTPLFIQQGMGNSEDNTRCVLYVEPGDELIIFAQKIDGKLVTTPCKRNSFIYKNDPKFELENKNLTGVLEGLSAFNEQIQTSTINCISLKNDADMFFQIEKLELRDEKAFFGLYNIKFNDDDSVNRIGVLSSFNKEVDKKIRIMLIKKKWDKCKLNENRELLVAYFYHPTSPYRKGFLSTF